jgi:ABC-type glycerol-3-phosphate transport system substrate-binding protein
MKKRNVLLFAALLALPACTSVKQELGLSRNSPDEFTVVKRAPLTMPPEYTLRPPVDASAPPAEETKAMAKAALLGSTPAPAAEGGGDRAMLAKLGAIGASPDIRKQIDEDNGYIALQNQPVAEKLIFWGEGTDPSLENIPSSVVDPEKEAQRLKQNAAEGKPASEGTVPVIEKKKSTIDKIF